MLRAQGILSTTTPVKGGLIINPYGVIVPSDVPILDSHLVSNGLLGHIERVWLPDDDDDDPVLMGSLIFTGAAGRRVYDQVERGVLNGVSPSFNIENVAIFDGDGDPLDVDEAIERKDDPSLVVVVTRAVLREVSIVTVPADPNACIRACSIESQAWQMIDQGQRALRKILRPDRGRDVDDEGDLWTRVLADRQQMHYGAAELIE